MITHYIIKSSGHEGQVFVAKCVQSNRKMLLGNRPFNLATTPEPPLK